MKKRLKLQEIEIKSFTTSGKETTGGTGRLTFICTLPYPICVSLENTCEHCFP